MADDPWAAFRVAPAAPSAAPAEDPWAAFRVQPAQPGAAPAPAPVQPAPQPDRGPVRVIPLPRRDDDGLALVAPGQTPIVPDAPTAPGGGGLEVAQPGGVGGAVRQIADGATFGLADKLAASGRALTGDAPSYEAALAEERALTKAGHDANPVAATSAQLVGGLASGLGLAKAGLTVLPLARDGGLFLRSLLGGLEGAGYGAASGAGHTDGSAADYAKNAAVGARAGSAVGVGLPVIGTVASKLYQYGAPLVRSTVPETSRAAGGLLETAASADRDGLSRLSGLGEQAMLADAGPSFLGLAQGVATKPGEGRSSMVRAVTERNDLRSDRLAQDVAENLGPARSPVAATQDILAARKAETGPMFTAALDAAPPVDASNVLAIIGQRLNKAEGPERIALLQARDMLLEKNAAGRFVPKTDAERLHNVKGTIDGWINYGDPKLGVPAGALNKEQGAAKQVRGALNDVLREQVPGYAEANDASRAFAQRAQAVEDGTRVLDGGKTAMWPSDLNAKLAGMSPEAQDALRLGVRADVENKVGTAANDLAALKKAVGGERDWNRDKMASVFGQEPTDAVVGAIDREQRFANTYADIARNSATAPRAAASGMIDAAAEPLIPKNTTMTGLAGNIAEKLARAMFNGIAGAKSAADRAELGRVLSATGPERDRIITELLGGAEIRAKIGDAIDQALRSPGVVGAIASERGRRATQ